MMLTDVQEQQGQITEKKPSLVDTQVQTEFADELDAATIRFSIKE